MVQGLSPYFYYDPRNIYPGGLFTLELKFTRPSMFDPIEIKLSGRIVPDSKSKSASLKYESLVTVSSYEKL